MIHITKKKILIAALFVIFIVLVAASLLIKFNSGLWPWEFLDVATASISFSKEQAEQKALSFSRNYPEIIKGNWEPSSFHMTKMLNADSGRIKKLGVNTVSISAEYGLNKDGSYYLRDEELLLSNIVKAKENGFAVLVAPNFVGPTGHNFKEEGIDVNEEKYLKISEEIALKWAEISEKYKVEFFAPQNEFNFMVGSNFAEDNESKKAMITSKWHKDMLPKIKNIYTGRTVAKLADPTQDIDVTGYDYVGMTISHGTDSLDGFRNRISDQYKRIQDIAKRSNTKWMVSEAWFPYSGPFYQGSVNRNGESLDGLQDDYFRISIEEYKKITENKPVGYIFIAWIMPGMDVKNRPAEKVLEDFYSN